MTLWLHKKSSGKTRQVHSRSTIQNAINAGKLGPNDLVGKSPDGPWKQLGRVKGLTFPNRDRADNTSDDGDIFSGPIGSWGEAIEEEDYHLYDIPPKRQAKRKDGEADDFNPRTGEGKYRRLVENNESPNKFVTVLYVCWDAVPTFVKLLALVVALAYIIVVMPLLHFQEESYWDEGGPYGHNTTDTLYMAKARGGGHNDVADFHLARRELRKAIVRVHRAVDMLVDNEVVTKQEAKNYQSVLQSMAEEFSLTQNVWGKDMFGLGAQTSVMSIVATQANAFADQLSNPDFVDQIDEKLKGLRSQ